MLRHAIAPARFFTQVSNDIIRHPRLSSDAVRLLAWQLSLPEGADEALSRTAARAGIGKCAFLRAKRELIVEGYFHEWREQGVRGLWSTVQLVSNVPLSGEEAAASRASAQVAAPGSVPTDGSPAVGEPTGRAVGRHPEPPVPENTSHHPAPTATATSEQQATARQLIESLGDLDARLHVPRGILPELAALAAEWLACGHTVADVREQVRRCLPGQGQFIHRPGGLVRYVLREIPPVVTPVAAAPAPTPRVAQMRECEGDHVQALLFRPVADEVLCRGCRRAQAADAWGSPAVASVAAAVRGAAAVRAVLRPLQH
ncbi:hypothetical protein [Streptomyces sp. NBC_00996]|uniref:hypothetical protein n=1 Tax=Streptomyces sp. NBC_00996 TaxID=2903710 RepID=UPI0038668F52|nr:hypothetical protein OG390_32365 [Streptomyces sp. NBC_00996]